VNLIFVDRAMKMLLTNALSRALAERARNVPFFNNATLSRHVRSLSLFFVEAISMTQMTVVLFRVHQASLILVHGENHVMPILRVS